MALEERQIAFIGSGHITEFLVKNLTETQTVPPSRLIASDPRQERRETLADKYGVSSTADNLDALSHGDFIFINVQPHVVPHIIEEFTAVEIPHNKVIVTLAAGITIENYRRLGNELPVVRILPNPPSQIGQGVIAATFNHYVTEAQKEDINALLETMGMCIEVEERLINAVMAMTTPANVFLFFQSLIDAGIRQGIDRESSTRIAYQTIVGSMEVWKQRKEPPSELIGEASTPGGISVEGLYVLEKHAFRAAINEAIDAATKRAEKFCIEPQE